MNNYLDQYKNVFFLGIKGVAMANLAIILKKIGKKVNGVDVSDEFITDKLLKENDINYQIGFDCLPANIDLLVYSAAHQGKNNFLVKQALKRKVKVIHQAELLGWLMASFENKIAVAGCHGKTTTSSLLAYALIKLKQKPSYIVGAPFFGSYQGGDFQGTKYFLVEADEYGINPPIDKTPKFFKLNPDWIICTNIDFDHPDVYQNIEETKAAFLKFFDNKKLILNIDDENLFQCFKELKLKEKVISYGFSSQADYQIISWRSIDDGSEFEIKKLGNFQINLYGKHNVLNATAVIVQLLKLGFKIDKIKKSLLGFVGAKRRFELVYYKDDIYFFDDYAHHPQEIKATILAARERFKNKRIIVIFQPHTYSRTQALISEFKKSLSIADIGFILPIFPSARENKDQFSISSKDIVKGSKNLFYYENNKQLIKRLNNILKKGDIVFTMGAGDVYKLKVKSQKLKVNHV